VQSRLLIVTSVAFVIALLLAGGVFYKGELVRVEDELLSKARLLMDLADTTRLYTNDEVLPLVAYEESFHKASVPSYASRRITEELLKRPQYAGYSIREAALAPILVTNRASDWEAGVIHRFTAQEPAAGFDLANLPETVERRTVDGHGVLALAKPIVMPPTRSRAARPATASAAKPRRGCWPSTKGRRASAGRPETSSGCRS